MADFDILIKGGTIVDGTRTPRYVSDIAIKDGKIAQIGGLKGKTADRVLDAAGRIVAPGFVDLHTHYDAQIFWDPYCTLSGWHGVTSVALGNCGFGFAPSRAEDRDRAMLGMTRNEAIPYDAMKAGMPWNWVTFPDFINSLTRTPKGVNCLTYVPLTPLYAWVMGWEEAKRRRPTEAELQEMCRLIHEAMDAGACGWSAQVLGPKSIQRDYDGTPMITDLLSEHEILTFAKVLADRDEGFIELAYQETGEEGRPLAEATKQFFEKVAAAAKRPVLYQAVAPNSVHPEQHRERIRWLESCAERGLRVYGQGVTRRGGFEMTFADWNLFDDTEAWRDVTLGTKDERKAKMQDPEMRRRLKEEWDAGIRPTTVVPKSVGSLIVQKKSVKIDIGAESAFPTLPAPVEVGGASYFLIKTRDGYRLLSRVCPHLGGTVEDGGAQFVCPDHGYQYDKDGGKCLNAAGLRMKSYVVNVQGGRLIASAPDEKAANLAGQTVQQIADAQGKHVIDALLDMVVEDDLETEFLAETQGRDAATFTTEVVNSNVVVAGVSDGGAHVKFLTAGIYPTDLLTWLVRDEKTISLEDAHYKLSYLPAHLGGFKDRGVIRENAPADIVVYDLEKLEVLPSEVAEDLPGGEWRRIQKSKGYNWILVNGEITFVDGEPTGALPGKFLRNGRG
ncbi:MAG TPA: amidohydrolase family protein [Stellaceae bacterium]|nr:amidohydrolase family protein [Stellaceae bacterium]